jgi:FkbM family methyltransferase
VLAIEPEPTTFDMLTENVRTNGLTDVELRHAALTAHPGPVEFHHRPGSLVSSVLPERGPADTTSSVPGIPLSTLLAERVDFLKLDVEGSENDVLEELAESGKLLLVDQMACEYHHHITADRQSLASLLALLEEQGFGYQLRAHLPRAFVHDSFQDVLIYAYRRPVPALPA